ncbi:hypothetical protein [Kosmotoga pacifica]|uniref:Uncharacterized protein n=1 Tax=Kosmotoga pacifica TaxID=1330330 RepID=A0A0G2ZCS3_9BACT|nr:hypothetical protein [Kosmotoga pacifica]AKI97354.1 hypothetical protein IX53_05445 [Kosmotoga pacifica]
MKKFLAVFLVLFAFTILMAETIEIPITINKTTDSLVPVRISMNKLLDLVGIDFDANWDSIRFIDEEGAEVPYQIDDVDLNGKLSSGDYILVMLSGNAKVVVSDDFSVEAPTYDSDFYVNKTDDGVIVGNLTFRARINNKGLVRFEKFESVEGTIVDEIGIARIAGWVGSTYYVNGELGKHEEKTSGDFKVKEMKVLPAGPVAVTVVSRLDCDPFVGLEQIIVTSIFKNGDVISSNHFVFKTYADLMKLQNMITRPITDLSDDAVHMLPVFRRLVWADQLNITPLEYWAERNAIMNVNGKPYIVFPATDSMKPLWWGATYIFASQESWRSNYSPSKGIGVAEINPVKPIVYVNYEKWVNGNTWVYESREFRDGIFKWIPGEFEIYESTAGNVSTEMSDWPARFKAGDEVTFERYYDLYKSLNIPNAIEYLELRAIEIQSITIGE